MPDASTKSASTKLLLVSDNAKDSLTLRMMLADIKGKPYDIVETKTVKDGLQLLSSVGFGAVLLDLTIKGNKGGLAALVEIEKENSAVPIIILAGREDQAAAMEAVTRGAQDYLIKGRLDANVLARVIHYAMERHRVMREMKQKNQELARLNALKSEFVSTVSHELRTPLTVILSSSNNLLDGAVGALSDDQKKWVKKINGHALRLHEMINDILNLSKLQSGKAEMNCSALDVAEFVREKVDGLLTLAHERSLRLGVSVPTTLRLLWVDAARLEQVLTNLIGNAIKYTPTGGKITVSVTENSDAMEFAVQDTGPGVAPEHRNMIFERFRQIRQKDDPEKATQGIGLGLAISKEIVNHHGGKIWVESEPGQGSRFVFTIPFRPDEARPAKAA